MQTQEQKLGRYARFAPILVGNGYDTTPLEGKRPILQGWQTRPETALNFQEYHDKAIGILCGGPHNIVAIDVDVYDEQIAHIVGSVIVDELGFAPCRVGQAPKALYVFRCSDSLSKIKTAVFHINGKDSAVEVLAEGQQFVASGIHPDTGEKYKWTDDSLADLTPDDLTEVTPQQLRDFIAATNTLLSQYGERKGRESNVASAPDFFATNELEGAQSEVAAALSAIPNDDWHYDDWVDMAHAIKGSGADESDWHEFSRRSSKYDEGETQRVWDSIKEVRNKGAGTIYHIAREHGFDIADHRKQVKTEAREEKIEVEQIKKGTWQLQSMKSAPPEASVERRKFLYGKHLIRGFTSATVSPGGIGKTTIQMTEQVAMAINKPLLGDAVHEQDLRTLHVNLEDPIDELHRRYYAILRHFNIDHDSVADRVFLHSGRDYKVVLADRGEDGAVVQMPDAEMLRSLIIQNDIDVVQIDPLVKCHYLDENSNKDIDELFTILGQIADDTKCAIDGAHHVRKAPTGASATAGDINQARGASALAGAVRAARTLTQMTAKEAETFGIKADMAPWYLRIDNAKANMAAPAVSARWYERHSVRIDNGDEFSEGDSVGVLAPWSPPDAFEGLTIEKINEVLRQIERGPEDGVLYSPSKQAKNYAGKAITELVFDKGEGEAHTIIQAWKASGLIYAEEYVRSDTRKKAQGVIVDWSKQPGNTYE